MDVFRYLDVASVAAVSTSLLLPVFIVLMQRVGALEHEGDSDKSFARLSVEYAEWEKKAFLLHALFYAICAFTIWIGLSALSALLIANLERSVFLIAPALATWVLPAAFIGPFAGAIPLHYSLRSLLGVERYAEYNEYVNQKHGVKSWKATLWMAYVVIPVCVMFVFFSFDNYARVTERAFVLNRFLGVGETEYTYEKIRSLSLRKSFRGRGGEVVRKPHYVIEFQDGTAYDFNKTLHGLSLPEQAEIMAYIGRRAQMPVREIDPFPE